MPSLFLVLPLLVFFGLSAFFSLSETAILSSNRYKIKHLAAQGNRRAQTLLAWLDAPEKLLATILLGNNFASIGAATVSAAIVSRWVLQQYLDLALAAETIVLTIIILLFCELGPKAIAARRPEKISLGIVIPVEICMKLFYPITNRGVRLAAFFFRSVDSRNESGPAAVATEAELRAMIQGNNEEGARMLERVLQFSERPVRDVMVPRMEVTALDIGTPFQDILLVVEST